MGNCFGPPENKPEKKPDNNNTKPNDKIQDKKFEGKRLLLVGAGDSGKSTIFKQMKRLFAQGFTEDELKNSIPFILENVMRNMIQLCYATQQLQITVEESNIERRDNYAILYADTRAALSGAKKWNASMANDFKLLWADQGIKKVFREHRSTYLVEDGASFYFDKIEEIGKTGWTPTDEDVLRTRIKTTGLVEQPFQSKGKNFVMIDVGGQRTERRKWLHQFENVDAILYVCSLSEFDQLCYEDGLTNRMKESIELFQSYISSNYFQNSLVYLVMNKHDLFNEKIKQGIKLKDTFPNYTGSETDPEAAKNFIESMYKDYDSLGRLRGIIYLTALDKNNIKEKLEEIVDDVNNSDFEI